MRVPAHLRFANLNASGVCTINVCVCGCVFEERLLHPGNGLGTPSRRTFLLGRARAVVVVVPRRSCPTWRTRASVSRVRGASLCARGQCQCVFARTNRGEGRGSMDVYKCIAPFGSNTVSDLHIESIWWLFGWAGRGAISGLSIGYVCVEWTHTEAIVSISVAQCVSSKVCQKRVRVGKNEAMLVICTYGSRKTGANRTYGVVVGLYDMDFWNQSCRMRSNEDVFVIADVWGY